MWIKDVVSEVWNEPWSTSMADFHSGMQNLADVTRPIGNLVQSSVPYVSLAYGVYLVGNTLFELSEDKLADRYSMAEKIHRNTIYPNNKLNPKMRELEKNVRIYNIKEVLSQHLNQDQIGKITAAFKIFAGTMMFIYGLTAMYPPIQGFPKLA